MFAGGRKKKFVNQSYQPDYAWTSVNEWSLHSASIFNNLLGRQLLAKNFTDHLLDHMSRSRTLFERSSHPSKSFLCISMCMLQSGALVFVGRLVEAILWREFLPRCRIHLPCVWHDGKIDVMNMKLPGKTNKTSDGSFDHMGNKHSFNNLLNSFFFFLKIRVI